MDLDYFLGAVLSPPFVAAMVLAGIGYGLLFLWALDIRDAVRLYLVAVVPGIAFLAFVFLSRYIGDGRAIALYPLLMIDWLVFANTAVLAVLARRRLARRRRLRSEGGKE